MFTNANMGELFNLSYPANKIFDGIENAENNIINAPNTSARVYIAQKFLLRKLCDAENSDVMKGRMLVDVQLPDGTWPVTWLWHNDYTEFYVLKNMWKSNIIRQNMLYLRALGILEL